MSKINIVLDDPIVNGKLVSFVAPCESSTTTCLTINNVDYTICDTNNNDIGGVAGLWTINAVVSVILNTSTKRAYIQNAFATTTTYTASIPVASWIADETNGYYQTVIISGILSTDNPIADVVLGSDIDANTLYLKAWEKITRITTSNNSITLYAKGIPTSAFMIQLKVVR